jgi:hypothetical protein
MLWMGIWVHPYTDTCAGGVGFLEKNVLWLSPSDVVVSWLRLQTPTVHPTSILDLYKMF